MHRLDFLRALIGTPALLTLPPLELLPPDAQDRLAWMQDHYHILAYDGFVRGCQLHQDAQVIRRMEDHDELDLVRAYDNAHDPEAVAVYWQGYKLGYLAMGTSIVVDMKPKAKRHDSLHVRIPRSLKARLRTRSASNDRSMTQDMIDALEEKLASEDTDLKTGPGWAPNGYRTTWGRWSAS